MKLQQKISAKAKRAWVGREVDVVVEGVETAEQLKLVRSWGCRKVQGYYFSKPLPAAQVSMLLRAGRIVPESHELGEASVHRE